MTREEEIKQAAEEYYNKVKYLSDLSAFPIAAFKEGAEWADKIMFDRVREFIRKRFTETIVGNVISRQETTINEVIDDLRKLVEE